MSGAAERKLRPDPIPWRRSGGPSVIRAIQARADIWVGRLIAFDHVVSGGNDTQQGLGGGHPAWRPGRRRARDYDRAEEAIRTDRENAPAGGALVGVGVGLGLAIAVVGGVVRFANTEPPFRSGEWLGDVALAAVVAAPALLAVLSLRGRPALLTLAGALGIVQAVLDIPFSLLLLGPAALYLAGSSHPVVAVGIARRVASIILAVVLGIAAFWALFVLRTDPACYAVVQHDGVRTTVEVPAGRFVHPSSISMSSDQFPPRTVESGCTSDTISPWEGAASLAIIATLIAASWALAGPRKRAPEGVAHVTTT